MDKLFHLTTKPKKRDLAQVSALQSFREDPVTVTCRYAKIRASRPMYGIVHAFPKG
jgi:hypothetical protein